LRAQGIDTHEKQRDRAQTNYGSPAGEWAATDGSILYFRLHRCIPFLRWLTVKFENADA
jgi:hypothetical protein